MNEVVTPRDTIEDIQERISIMLVRRARLRLQLLEVETELERLERRQISHRPMDIE